MAAAYAAFGIALLSPWGSGTFGLYGGRALAEEAAVSHGERADSLRRASRSRAESKLGYENVPVPEEAPSGADSYSLGLIISRLGTIIQRLENERAEMLAGLPGLSQGVTGQSALTRTYGPDGPTRDSVRALLAYRLVQLGNPNLRPGPVTDDGQHIRATVLTKEGAVAAIYKIDRSIGAWSLVME